MTERRNATSLTEDVERLEIETERVQDDADEAVRKRSAAALRIRDEVEEQIGTIRVMVSISSDAMTRLLGPGADVVEAMRIYAAQRKTLDAAKAIRAAIDKLEEL